VLPKRTLPRHLLVAAACGVLLLLISYRIDTFRDYQMAQVAAMAVAVAGLTVLVGLSGQISLGNGGFMALGAYATALILEHLHWPLAVVFVAATLLTAAAGAVVGVAASRLHGPYLAGATLMFAVALPGLANRYSHTLGGDQGIPVDITSPAGLGEDFPLTRWQAWITALAALVCFLLLANLARGRVGRAFRAVRDDEVAAAIAGLHVARIRVLAFVISAGCAGLGGALLAVTTELVAPAAFAVSLSIALLAGAVLGGLGTLAGAIWGSLVLVLLPTYLTNFSASHGFASSTGSNLPIVVYGVVLVLVMLLFPRGINGGLVRLAARLGGHPPAPPDRPDTVPADEPERGLV
jgi:branched-chain amino acid transport system permease protein